MGAKGRKDDKLNHKTAFAYIITGLLIYFFSYLSLLVKIKMTQVALLYMGLATTGFLLVLTEDTHDQSTIPSNMKTSRYNCSPILK